MLMNSIWIDCGGLKQSACNQWSVWKEIPVSNRRDSQYR